MDDTLQGLLKPVTKHILSPWSVPDFYDLMRRKSVYFMFKRMIDIIFSVFVTVFFLSWIIPLIALLIKIDSRGPVFFIQRRVGRYGKTFRCIKFRTMKMNIEADFKQADENDERITKIGKFLRKSNIDELPQFLNVLAGHMSIVGPRPHMHKDCNDFTKVIKEYRLRNLVKPGITGMAQVKGFRGPTLDDISIILRFNWDAYYIKNASPALDWVLIMITAKQTLFQIAKILLGEEKLMVIMQRREYNKMKKMAA